MTINKKNNLYLVLTSDYLLGKDVIDVATQAVVSGIDLLQMREKDKPREFLYNLGVRLRDICLRNKVLFIVNDDPYLSRDLDADGLHLGQEDLLRCSLKEARSILGPRKIIGVSTHSLKEFESANNSDVDYIAFGPIFPTKTKNYSIGLDQVGDVLTIASKPVFFIGGINLDNITSILEKKAKNIAVIRAIAEAENIPARVKEFKMIIKKSFTSV